MLASPLDHPRVGVVVPKATQSSVKRNLLKRRLRELVRLRLLPQLASVDVVIRAARQAYDVKFTELADEVEVARAGLTTKARQA